MDHLITPDVAAIGQYFLTQCVGGRFPKEHDLINRRTGLEILDEMPAPVIETGDMPAQLVPAVK